VTAAVAYAVAALLGMAGLRIETATPEALCPAITAVRQAVSARVGQVEGTGEWRASYGLIHRPEGEQADVVRLDLYDPAGELRLRRDLPRAGQSCAAVAQAMVVMLESFFRRTAEAERMPPAPAEAVAVIASPPPPAAGRGWTPALDVLAGWAGGPSSAAVATYVRLSGLFGGHWEIGLGATWLLAEQEQAIGYGTASARSFAFRLHLDRRWPLSERVTARIGPEIVVALDRASTSGVPEGTSSFRGGLGLGANAALEARLSRWLALSLIAAADYIPSSWSGDYVVDNYGGPAIFPAERWRPLVAAGLTVSLPE
jgi:hypothetical protein